MVSASKVNSKVNYISINKQHTNRYLNLKMRWLKIFNGKFKMLYSTINNLKPRKKSNKSCTRPLHWKPQTIFEKNLQES